MLLQFDNLQPIVGILWIPPTSKQDQLIPPDSVTQAHATCFAMGLNLVVARFFEQSLPLVVPPSRSGL